MLVVSFDWCPLRYSFSVALHISIGAERLGDGDAMLYTNPQTDLRPI